MGPIIDCMGLAFICVILHTVHSLSFNIMAQSFIPDNTAVKLGFAFDSGR